MFVFSKNLRHVQDVIEVDFLKRSKAVLSSEFSFFPAGYLNNASLFTWTKSYMGTTQESLVQFWTNPGCNIS